MPGPKRILIYAYGNPGRQDDGLGNRFVEEMAEWISDEKITNVDLESNYQLNIEDAYNISDKDLVIFVDASVEDIDGIHFSIIEPSENRTEFTTHSASPAFVLALCHKLYKKFPETFMLQIKGYEWEFKEVLSDRAKRNLYKATAFMKDYLADMVSTKN